MVFTVRPEQPDDYDSIREVHERAFAPRVQEAAIVEDLRAEGSCVADLTLVALRGDDVVGHVCISRAHVDSALPILVLGPMGVLPEFQRRGAGSALMREALGRAAKTDFPLVSVVGTRPITLASASSERPAVGSSRPLMCPQRPGWCTGCRPTDPRRAGKSSTPTASANSDRLRAKNLVPRKARLCTGTFASRIAECEPEGTLPMKEVPLARSQTRRSSRFRYR
jgi:putative acetyltransferase